MKDFADPQALAEAAAQSMNDLDYTAQHMGMRIESVAPGGCVLSMPVQDWMINGHGICHGGLIFTLADTAAEVRSECSKTADTTMGRE